jgi:hypothetical protein
MPLSGVNKLCETCIQDCKQWEQIKIIKCPIYRSKKKEEKTKNT